MKNLLGLLVFITLLACSKKDDDASGSNQAANAQTQLIFGHFYGMCGGETCIETFKLTDSKLLEDTIDSYSGTGPFHFLALEDQKFLETRDLVDFLPARLLVERDSTFGCPDCADQGGIFIQYTKGGSVKTWRIDQAKDNVPDYLYELMDKVNEKIDAINS